MRDGEARDGVAGESVRDGESLAAGKAEAESLAASSTPRNEGTQPKLLDLATGNSSASLTA